MDGNQYHSENTDRNWYEGGGPNPYTKNGQPWDQRFHMLLNLAVGGNFFGNEPLSDADVAAVL